jgi:hypothetical protein
MEVNGQLHAPADLPPPPQIKIPLYPLNRGTGWGQELVWMVVRKEDGSAPAQNRAKTLQFMLIMVLSISIIIIIIIIIIICTV